MIIFTTFLLLLHRVTALRLDECSASALGMESGLIQDAQLTSSSSFDKQSVGPQNARIRTEKASGAWCPKPQIHGNTYEFLQISLERTYLITGIETQGRFGNGTGREYATEYMIDYLRPGSKWIRYKNRTGHTMMSGNWDTTTAVLRSLDPPIVASRIRIVPSSKQTRTICMRAELHGCVHRDGLLYYSAVPDGSRTGEYDFRDGIYEDSELYTDTGIIRGLGLLSDGYVAKESPFTPNSINSSWIGWNKHHTGGTVTLLFQFDQQRNLTEILLAAYGHRLENIDVIFSQDGSHFPLSSQITSKPSGPSNSTAKIHDIHVPLHRRMAKKVRMTVKFQGDWWFLTEVHFSSGLINEDSSDYLVLANDTTTQATETASEGGLGVNIFGILGMTLLAFILMLICCVALCCRRKLKDRKDSLYGSDVKRDLVITHMGGKSATQLFNHDFGSPFMGANLYSSDKTTSTSVSSKSTGSLGKTTPPTWSEFHFPPPPETPEERIYAEPCNNTLPTKPFRTIYEHREMPVSSMTTGRSKQIRKPDSSLHYAAGNLFTETYGFDKIRRFSVSDIQLETELGEGKFTVIRTCRIENRGRFVYKVAKDANNLHTRKALLDEIRTLSKCSHPNIVQLVGTDENAGLILEYLPNSDAKHFLQTVPEPLHMSQLLSICADVCNGMSYLESQGLVHGHLTPTHILLDQRIRAKVASPRGPSHPAQLRYSAPESIISNQFSCKSDVWAFAVCVHEILDHCQQLPYPGMSNTEIVENAERILNGETNVVLPTIPETVPRGLREILSRSFDAEPACRPSFSNIYNFINRFHL